MNVQTKKPVFFYNTLSRKIEEFKPIKDNCVGLYTCGPTVYSFPHIGNLRTYIFSDILKRVLEFNEFNVKHVMNITDVGHLTSDADEGEDKMEKAAKKEGKKAEEIASYYLRIFREDLKKINIIEPNIWCKATEHIGDQIKLIQRLENRGYTYRTSDGIYFDTFRFKKYCDFAKIDIDGLEAGKRVDMKEKRNLTDFALWKFSEEVKKRQQEWESPWGLGFPGWHIECSAMSIKYLGEHFDIHTGGVDHISVHHTNEIAQSECATGKKFVNYWLHGEFLTSKGEKISKSKGGLFTVSNLEEKGFDPLDYRYLTLTAHYRKQMAFSLDILKSAQNSLRNIKDIVFNLENDGKINEEYLNKFHTAINKDLQMPEALSIAWIMLKDKDAEGKYLTLKQMDRVFALDLFKKEKELIPDDILALVDQREDARKNKKWSEADRIRILLKEKGYNIEDANDGFNLRKD